MQNKQKILNLLGLAQRAGKMVSGTELVVAALRGGKAKAIFAASDLHSNTLKVLTSEVKLQGLTIQMQFNADELSHAIGKTRKVLAVMDTGFAKALMTKINEGV